ncbi:metallophosphoesterase [Nocardioides sp. 31GB23]|uniref:metallophosphoesterase n=1 Tax=Nocardioides sp. 31GB23 TaxID=3156065 RepID=UPI0032AEF2C4
MPEPDPASPQAAEPTAERGLRGRLLGHTVRGAVVLGCLAVWLGGSLLAAGFLFLSSEREVSLASHESVVRPTLSGQVELLTGPVLPDLRLASDLPLGVQVQLGKTEAASTDELVQRYALIASAPEGPQAKLRSAIEDMALDALLRGLVIGAVPVLVWLLLGRARRRQLLVALPTPYGVLAALLAVAMVLGLWQPWTPADDAVEAAEDEREWVPLADFVGTGVPLPDEVEGVEIRADLTTNQSRRLIESAVNTYDKSQTFYETAAEAAGELDLRTPEEGEVVVTMVSDRHDNIQMDAVARAVGDRAGATGVLDGGDDTSTGSSWEAFSLDSVSAAFEDQPRWGVAGNHDNGTFVVDYLADQGWTMLDGEVVEGPGGGTLLGVADPRASGLGSWRDEGGLSFEEVGERLADAACAADEPIDTVLVHDANLASEALRRGCVDLVVGGHLHVQEGPDPVVADEDPEGPDDSDGSDGTDGSDGPDGPDESAEGAAAEPAADEASDEEPEGEENPEETAPRTGYRFTMGTTGGAAYAIALGSKIRREAQVSLITYRDGSPVGIQTVNLQTNGVWVVDDYVELAELAVEPDPDDQPTDGPAPGPIAPGDGLDDGLDDGAGDGLDQG